MKLCMGVCVGSACLIRELLSDRIVQRSVLTARLYQALVHVSRSTANLVAERNLDLSAIRRERLKVVVSVLLGVPPLRKETDKKLD